MGRALFNVVMYALFGFMLSVAGVSITTKPAEFLCLLGILMAVDFMSFVHGRNS